MDPVLAAFPTRPLAVRPVARTWIGTVVALVVLLGVPTWFVADLVPDLVHDNGLRGTAQPVAEGRISNGRCRTYQGLLTNCGVTLSRTGKGRADVTRTASYFFVTFHTGDYTAAVMADPARPEALTTDIGLDYFWNRLVCLLLIVAILLGIAAAGVAALLAPYRARRLARSLSGRPLTPLLVERTALTNTSWTVRDDAGGTTTWPVPPNSDPFFAGGQRILAVTAPGAGGAVPLDAALSWLDFTDDERGRLREAANLDVTRPVAEASAARAVGPAPA